MDISGRAESRQCERVIAKARKNDKEGQRERTHVYTYVSHSSEISLEKQHE